MTLEEDIYQWIKDLPRSRMGRPSTFSEWLRYWFWLVYTPFHPYARDIATRVGIVKHTRRQEFLIGAVDSSRNVRDLVSYLIEKDFGNHFVAWKDPGELISLRRTDGFKRQYHLRIFKDGEIRCHYEYTPEYRPINHLTEIGFENRATEFLNLLQGWIVPSSELAQAMSPSSGIVG
ncbi:MAG: hypothetical protein ACYC4I_01680 [Minisyncoccota bacterium]